MRWVPQSARWRVAAGVAGGVLLLGAIVGYAGPDGGDVVDGSAFRVEGQAGQGMLSGGVSGGGGSGIGVVSPTSGGSAGATAAGSRDMAAAEDHGGDASDGVDLPGEPALAGSIGERIVKTADLHVDLDEDGLDRARHDVLRIVDGLTGFVQASSVSDARATFTIRVPAGDFEKLLTRVRELGEVVSEEITGEDVSEEFVDLEARLRHWRAQEAVFLDLMARATTVSETIEVRRELSNIQQTIEQLEGRLRFLTDRVSMSTLTLHLTEPGVPAEPPADDGTSLAGAWDDAVDAGETVVGGTLVVLGALVPLSVILGVPTLLVWSALRRRRPPTPSPSVPA